MRYIDIFYLNTTCHASIFDIFCGIYISGSLNIGTFGGVVKPPHPLKTLCCISLFFNFISVLVYAHT